MQSVQLYFKFSMHIFCTNFHRLSRSPELKLRIASDSEMIEQIMTIPLIPSSILNQTEPIAATALLLSLSHDTQTHEHVILHEMFCEFLNKDHSEKNDWFESTHKLVK